MIKKIFTFSFLFVLVLGLGLFGWANASDLTGSFGPGLGNGVGGMDGVVKAAPTVSPAAGTYHANQSVTLSASSSSAICYTTNGTTPACSTATACATGTVYSTAISASSSVTIKSAACYNDNTTGPVASVDYVLTCSTASVTNGTVAAYPSCAITCSSGYTLSGSTCVSSGGLAPGGGGGGGDTTAPNIASISAAPGTTQATITWTTNESSLTWAVYGTTTAYGLQQKSLTYTTIHSAVLTNLIQGTVYHYQLKSQDSSGNVGSYADKFFTTLGTAPVTTTTPAATTTPTATTTAATTTTPTATTPSTTPTTPTTLTKPVSQMTVPELQAMVVQIGQLIIALQAELAKLTGTPTTPSAIAGIPASFTFQTTLKFGMVLQDVKYLQLVLNSDPTTKIANSGVGSPGRETNIFGALTTAAVIKFQEKYRAEILTPASLTAGTGIVGSSTRAKLNSLLGK